MLGILFPKLLFAIYSYMQAKRTKSFNVNV